MSDRDPKPDNITSQTWHSRHQRAEELPSYSAERWQERVAGDGLTFVARASGRIHGPSGDGEGEGEWRVWVWPTGDLNGPEALLGISFDWTDDIAESAKHESLGGIALDVASCETLAEATIHARLVLEDGQWIERSLAVQSYAAHVLTRAAAQDTDAVSMFSCGTSESDVESSVVVLRGPELVARFRDWAEAQGVFTRGKPVEELLPLPHGLERDPRRIAWKQGFDSVWAGVTGLLEVTTSVHARERLAAARQALDDAGCAELGYEQPDDLGVWRGETCKRCHRRNVVGFTVADEVWARVTQERWTVLCTTCFDEQAHLLGVPYEFIAVYPVSWSDGSREPDGLEEVTPAPSVLLEARQDKDAAMARVAELEAMLGAGHE
jgi:hypothetical protein